MPITVTPSTLPNGTPGTSYSQALSASGGTAPYAFRLKSGHLPPGLQFSAASGNNAGCTIAWSGTPTKADIQTNITRWSNLVYPIAVMKIYFNPGQFPTPATASAAPAAVQACITLGVPVILCYKLTFSGTANDTNWPGGADKPAIGSSTNLGTILGDQAAMLASIAALRNIGVTVAAIVFNQEGNSTHNNNTWDQFTYLYYKNYGPVKAAHPNIPVISIQSAYYTTNAHVEAFFPGPTPVHPTGYSGFPLTNQLYCDGICADWYQGAYTSGQCYMYSGKATTNPGYADLADYANVIFGVTESGNSASGGNPPNAQVIPYLSAYPVTDPSTGLPVAGDPVNSMQAVYQQRQNNGLGAKTLGPIWYENDNSQGTGANRILIPGDYRIAPLQEIAANTAGYVPPVTIGGTPTTAGVYHFTVAVTDSASGSATANLSITVGATTLQVTTTSLPGAAKGLPYSASLAATGGTPFT